MTAYDVALCIACSLLIVLILGVVDTYIDK